MKLAAACVVLAFAFALTPASYADPAPGSSPEAAAADKPYPLIVCTSLETARHLTDEFEQGGFVRANREYVRLREEAVWSGRRPPCFRLMYTQRSFEASLIERGVASVRGTHLFYKLILSLRQGSTTYYVGFMRLIGPGYSI